MTETSPSIPSATDPPDASLLRALTVRRNDLRQLLDLSRAQLQMIESDDFDSLWRLQQQKQRLVDRVQPKDETPPTLRERWLAQRHALSHEARRRCEELISDSESALQLLMQEEAVNSHILEDRLGDTRRQLRSLAEGHRSREQHQLTQPPQRGQLMDLDV